jgi:polysaccharide export outer membrane protein
VNQNLVVAVVALIASVAMLPASAGQTESLQESQQITSGYLIQPGDVLQISVWREPDLQADVVVSPDGRLSMPLLGEIDTDGKSIELLRNEIVARIQKFVPDADVTVMVKQPLGNKIYVIGKVNRPGEYVLNRNVDVMQALSMAAGIAKFADEEKVKILRRSGESQHVIPFDYSQVEAGEALEQNIILKPGDVVVVP